MSFEGPFRLTPIEQHNPVWLRVQAHLQQRLAVLREQNDDLTMPPEKTSAVRGRIAEIKQLLALGAPPREPIDS